MAAYTALISQRLTSDIKSPVNPWVALWILGMALSWLNPNHFAPWTAFDAEASMAAIFLIAGFAATLKFRDQWALSASSMVVLGISIVPLLQASAGLIYFSGDAWMCFLYILGFALCIVLGEKLQSERSNLVANVVLSAAAIAGFFSVGLQLYQWLDLRELDGLSGLGIWVMVMPSGSRPFANLAQPNLLATLLMWSLVAVWWAHLRGQLRAWVATCAGVFLLFGVAMSQSRSAWLGLLVMCLLALRFREQLQLHRQWPVLLGLAIYFVLLVLAWDAINEAAHLSTYEPLQRRVQPGVRGMNWRVLAEAVALRSWFGYGWGQVAVAQYQALLLGPASGEYLSYAHNLLLDLIIWNGVPIGISIGCVLFYWLAKQGRKTHSSEGALLLIALTVMMVHSMLEFPHAYAYFLLPAGLMVGALNTMHSNGRSLRLPVMTFRLLVTGAAVLSSCVVFEYGELTAAMERLRFKAARVGNIQNAQVPELRLLTQWNAFLAAGQLNVHESMTVADLELTRQLSERYPGVQIVFRYAMAAAIAGQPKAAEDALRRACVWMRVHETCDPLREAWATETKQRHPEMALVRWPEFE